MKRDIPYPRNVLMSFHYFKDYDLDRLPNLTIIGDSGAFSAESQGARITTPELATWAKKWRHRLLWIASLDVIGDPRATYRNWRDMVDNHGVEGVPTIHFGTDPAEMDKYAKRGVDFMGLGGLVRVPTKAQMRWLIQVFKYQRRHHPDMRFHGWGCTSEPHLKLPFFSVDSSAWTASVRYGQMVLREPGTNKSVLYMLDGREVYQPHVARLLLDHYGVSPKEVAVSNAGNRQKIVRLSALAESVKEQHMRRLHKSVSTPTWGINRQTEPGQKLHLALGYATGNTNPEQLNELHEGPRIHLAEGDGLRNLPWLNEFAGGTQ